ncbi:MAG: haloalkane dehalogenase [Acidimicrobiia bacterium]|nr:haloalkane dehalogenase [Acidimicrobiia bacterium]
MMFEKKFASVLGKRMAYIEEGEGDPIVFLHGNPTSSFLWRKVIPALAGRGRCLAPDLIGMGDSEKLADSSSGSYRFVEHRRYLDALLEQLDVNDHVTLVVHDWGSALGFDWARRHQEAVAGIAYMEALIGPISWDDWPESARSIFRGFRSETGEQLVLEKNYFVERVLPASVLDSLPTEVMKEYRRPFLEPGESRRPTLTWPREIPIDGVPADVNEIASSYNSWLRTSSVAKLFVNADPGFFSSGIAQATRDWSNQETVTVRGHHFVQEDSGEEIGQAIADWLEARRRETLAK